MTYSYERKTIVSTTEILIGEEDPPQENNICISSLHVCSQNKKDVSLQSIASLLLAFDIKVCSRGLHCSEAAFFFAASSSGFESQLS